MHPHLLALVMTISLAFAQPNPATAEKNARLEGRAFSTAGESIRKATVRLMGGPTVYTEITDNEGKFLFDDVAPGRYFLTAEKAGFVNGRFGARSSTSPGTQLSVSAGQELKDLAFLLTPQGVIAGRVTDPDGDPVRGVQVMVLRTGYGGAGRRQWMPSGAASTDDQGNFRAGSLAPGRYYLSALARSGGYFIGVNERPGRATTAPPETNVTTYYPQALDIASAAAIDVTAGAELAGYNIRLRKARTYSIRGKAVDASGAPPQNVLLRAVPKMDGTASFLIPLMSGAMQQVRPPDGSFEFRNLTPGTYTVQTVPGGNVNGNPVSQLTGRLEVTIAEANIEGAVLHLGPGSEITGTLRLEGGDLSSLPPVQTGGFTQVLNAAGTPVASGGSPSMRPSINLAEAENLSFGRPFAQIKEDGTFKLQAAAFKYVVNIAALPEGTYVKSIRFDNQDVTHDLLDLTSSGGGTLDIVLSAKAADVSGVVRDDKGAAMAGIPITIWPKTAGSSSSGVRSGSTDQNGSFKISSLTPGEYFAAAWDDPEPGLTQNPEFAAKFTSDAAAVKLSESSHETVALKLISRERIAAEAAKLP